MSRTALRRAVGLSVVLIALSLALGYVRVGGTFAIWNGETSNPSSAVEAGWIPPPTGASTPTPSGLGATLSWTAAASPATGTQLMTADGGTGTSASCGTYGSATAVTSPTTTGTTGTNGHWWCYEIQSTSATAWTSSLVTFTPIRVGLYPTTATSSNGGTSGTLDSGDTITITFNQNVGTVSGTYVCAVAGASGTGVLLIGDSKATSTTCASSDTYTIGKLTGITVGGSGSTPLRVSTSTATNKVTVTVSGAPTQTGPTVASTGTSTFTASTSVSSSATPTATACTSASAPVCVVSGTNLTVGF